MDEEIWCDVKGYEGLYQVSNWGRVKSLNYNHAGKEQILKPDKDKGGYLSVRLYKNREHKKYLVHRLVLMTFSPVENSHELQVNHKDECKTNNNLSNLEWCTCKENCNHGTKNKRAAEKLRGHIVSDETRRKIGKANKGHIVSEKTKQKLSKSLKGRTLSETTKQKRSKPIVQLDLYTNKVVNVWGSAKDAARECGYDNSSIIKCCKGKLKTHGSYKWQYLHVYMHNIDPRIKKVILFNKEYEF